MAISKFYIGGALSLVILDIFTWSLLTAGYILSKRSKVTIGSLHWGSASMPSTGNAILGIKRKATRPSTAASPIQSPSSTFFHGASLHSPLTPFSLGNRNSEFADHRILLVLIYILIAIERIRFRHGRRNSRQDDSIALFTLEHRGQFQLHLNQEAEKGSSQRLSLPDLGGEINWPFKNDITVQGRRQRYI